MKQVSLRLDDELHAAIERARGDVPRERWMRGALLAASTGAHGHPVTQATGSAAGTVVQGRQPKASHPKPAVAPIAQRAGVAPRVHHPRCVCPICKPPKNGGKR